MDATVREARGYSLINVDKRPWAAISLGALIVVMVAYLPSLLHPISWRDDHDWLALVRAHPGSDALLVPLWGYIWRPPVALYFMLLSAAPPLLFHLTSVLLQAGVACLTGAIVWRVTNESIAAVLAATLAAAMAQGAEAVYWASSVGIIEAAACAIGSLLLADYWLRSGRGGAIVIAVALAMISLLASEDPMFLGLLLAGLGLCYPAKRRVIVPIGLFILAASAAINAFRVRITSTVGNTNLREIHPKGITWTLREMTSGVVRSLAPLPLHSPGGGHVVPILFFAAAAVTLLLGIVALREARWTRRPTLILLVVSVLSCLPIVLTGRTVAMRYSYLPSLSGILLYGIWLSGVLRAKDIRLHWMGIVASVAIVSLAMLETIGTQVTVGV